jgi:Tfp pilus assembly protein PilV
MTTRHLPRRLFSAGRDTEERSAGFSLLEVGFAMGIILTILLGVMASISTASVAEMNASEGLASQLLLSQTVEEVKNNSFDNLITYNGQTVTSGTNTATIQVAYLTTDLVRIQVNVVSSQFAGVTNSAVQLIANTN